MPDPVSPKAEARLTLKSQLAELARVQQWVDELARRHQISAETVNAIQLCLEEALSNVIRHGYAGQPTHALTVAFHAADNSTLTFTIEDGALPFNPLEVKPPSTPPTLEDLTPGGQGIHLMRRFAGSLAWQPLPRGNRLTLTFPYGPPRPDPR